jgi:hypothetical protein
VNTNDVYKLQLLSKNLQFIKIKVIERRSIFHVKIKKEYSPGVTIEVQSCKKLTRIESIHFTCSRVSPSQQTITIPPNHGFSLPT